MSWVLLALEHNWFLKLGQVCFANEARHNIFSFTGHWPNLGNNRIPDKLWWQILEYLLKHAYRNKVLTKHLLSNKLNTRSSHRIEKKCNCNVKNLILCSCRHCNLWNYFGGVSLGNPRKLILVLLSYFLQQSSRLSFNNLQSTVYHSVYHAYGSHYCLFFRVFFFKLHDPLKFF